MVVSYIILKILADSENNPAECIKKKKQPLLATWALANGKVLFFIAKDPSEKNGQYLNMWFKQM